MASSTRSCIASRGERGGGVGISSAAIALEYNPICADRAKSVSTATGKNLQRPGRNRWTGGRGAEEMWGLIGMGPVGILVKFY